MTTWTTSHLAVPGATLGYETTGPDGAPWLALVGHPMGADDFRALGEHLAAGPAARRVLLHDPRGFGASPLDDQDDDADPDRLADDLAALLAAVGVTGGLPHDRRADVFGSSGGAVTGLAFAERHPHLLGTLLAHEPPLYEVLPDAEEQRAQAQAVVDTFRAQGLWPAMGAFMTLAGFEAPPPGSGGDGGSPPPPPQEPTAEQVASMTRLVSRSIVPVCSRVPDVAALHAAEDGGSRVVLLAGRDSAPTQLARRGAEAVAALLGREAVPVTGGHVDWVPWQGGDPERFAAQVRELLGAGR